MKTNCLQITEPCVVVPKLGATSCGVGPKAAATQETEAGVRTGHQYTVIPPPQISLPSGVHGRQLK